MIRATAFQALQPLFVETDQQLRELRQELLTAPSNLVVLSKHPLYPDRADYFPSGFFRSTGDKVEADLGSGAEYTAFRDTLATRLLGKSAAEIVSDPQPGPFMELICFSPLGQHYIIGPKTAEKLARDFADRATDAQKVGGVFWTIYERLMRSFAFAAKSGAVRFSS